MPRFELSAIAIVIAVGGFGVTGESSAHSEEEELALAYGDRPTISIATGSNQPVSRAPAIATVITAQDIRAMGAIDLDEVLETVPGLHVSRSNYAYTPIYNIRGINSQFNPQVLMLLNGNRTNSILLGDRGMLWGGYPIENIARIEVIRGPGSALYGADAFAGVINIVTKDAADINGTEAGLRVGSYRSRDGWLLHGGKWGDADIAAYVRAGATDGYDGVIEHDAQTRLDALFGTRASLAPGSLRLGRDMFDGALDVVWEHWRLHVAYKERSDVEAGAGIAQALDNVGSGFNRRFMADLTYRTTDWAKDWDISLQAGYFHMRQGGLLVVFPPGAFGGRFPEGMIGTPGQWEQHGSFGASAYYTGVRGHRMRFGAGVSIEEIYRTEQSRNSTFVHVPGVGPVVVYTGPLAPATDETIYLKPHGRTVRYAYVQDEIKLAQDWYMTVGLRHDRFSDFGGTTNPRIALVWEAAYDLTAKLLAGKAFRAPTMTELYNINNPVNIGNPHLRPEKISTLELAFVWSPSRHLQTGLSLYKFHMDDMIQLVPNADPTTGSTAANVGFQDGRGGELEATWDVSRRLRLTGNYAYQRTTNRATGSDRGYAPRHHAYARADWRATGDWRFGTQINRVVGRKREYGDNRPPVPDYHTVDLTLRHEDGKAEGWDLTASVRNVFDARVFEPSLAPGEIRYDLPMPGRNFVLQAAYRFK